MPLVTLTLREGKSGEFKTAVPGAATWSFGGGRIIHA
jgi:hypothetical protein